MGVGACPLGYADQDVNTAVKKAIDDGSMSSLNCPEEVMLARTLCDLHPWASMARFAKTGGEAMAIAVRIARVKRKRDVVLFCGYHGWNDWYLAANIMDDSALDDHLLAGLSPQGVPKALKGTAIPFEYNDQETFLKLIEKYADEIAAVVMEPIRNHYPKEGFLETIRQVTKQHEIVLIFDEITSGWRLTVGGAHLELGVNPDVAVFAKGMSNGFPISAIIGTTDVMSAANETFISSTYWTEKIGLAAALATIEKMKRVNLPAHLNAIGEKVQTTWRDLAEKYQLAIKVTGIYPLSHFSFEHKEHLILKTLFIQLMLEKGYLASNSFYVCYVHTVKVVDKYLEAVDEVFKGVSIAVLSGDPERHLKGPVCQTGFQRLT